MSASDSDRVFELFERYAAAFARGERPEAGQYLKQAGKDADELAELLDRFLVAAPRREPDAKARALLDSWVSEEPPLLAIRVERGLKVDAVVAELVKRLGLDGKTRPQVKRRYQQLEGGPARAEAGEFPRMGRTWRLLGDAARWRPAGVLGANAAYDRRPDPQAALFDVAAAPVPGHAMERELRETPGTEPDEVDRLFGIA